MFLPTDYLVKKELYVTELTPLQINMLTMIEQRKLELLWGGGKENG